MTADTDLKYLKEKLKECKIETFNKEQVYQWIKTAYYMGRDAK